LTLLQVLIPVTEVQVKASTVKDMSGHYLWELIHLKSQVQRRTEKVYHLSNRSGSSPSNLSLLHAVLGNIISRQSLIFFKPHCKKRLLIFPSPAGMSLTKLSLAGNN
jgi:hypothetical protein